MTNKNTPRLAGNAQAYGLERVQPLAPGPLRGKRIAFLGSSVTLGACSEGTAFPEYIAARNGCTVCKEAVSGTTLTDDGADSYLARLKKMDRAAGYDIFAVQLSTNDASQNKPLGSAAGTDAPHDTSTVCGAIAEIAAYVRGVWGCPLLFYTNCRYESAAYSAMVGALHETARLCGFAVADLYSDDAFNDITAEQRALYMADAIHPTKAGYLLWWTPAIERALCALAERGAGERPSA